MSALFQKSEMLWTMVEKLAVYMFLLKQLCIIVDGFVVIPRGVKNYPYTVCGIGISVVLSSSYIQ